MSTDISLQGLPYELQQKLIELSKSQNEQERSVALNDICKAGNVPQFIDIPPATTQTSVPWEQFRNDYILKVESGNQYIQKLEQIEKKFFETKYGSTLYDMLKSEREVYKDEVIRQIAEKYDYISKNSLDNPVMYRQSGDIKGSVMNQIKLNEALNELATNDVADSLKDGLDYIDKELKQAYGSTYTNLRKVEYRNQEIDKIYYWNGMMNVIFYIILISVFIVTIFERKMTIRMFTILTAMALVPLFVLPFLYKYTIKIVAYIYDKFNPVAHGPKNAFIDQNATLYKKSMYDV